MMLFSCSGLFLLLHSSIVWGQITENSTAEFEDRINGTYEDQENFQNQELFFSYRGCDEKMLNILGKHYCWEHFNHTMFTLGKKNWCDMDMVIRSYNTLTECLETSSKSAKCFYPNPVVEHLFVSIHQLFFSLCGDAEGLPDAPAHVVLATTLLPIFLIPLIVYIVVWKSSLRN